MIIAIDGPAGAGKSTIAQNLAHRLKIQYLDTGAMYRALTLKALKAAVPLDDPSRLVELARATQIRLEGIPPSPTVVLLDGRDVSQEIRTPEVTNHTFYIAREPLVREIMVEWQRQIGRQSDLVVEGRDIGTVVFPQATYKFYLDANFNERASRRIKELREKGVAVDDQRLKAELQARDHKDFTRAVGALKIAADAVVIDSTSMSVPEVVDTILQHIQPRSKQLGLT